MNNKLEYKIARIIIDLKEIEENGLNVDGSVWVASAIDLLEDTQHEGLADDFS
jgi:hypothetical protein